MSKKKTGLLIALGAAIGAAAAGISYYLKYKSFNDELDKDFHDYEDEETSSGETGKGTSSCTPPKNARILQLEPGKCKAGEEKMLRDRKTQNRPPKLLPRKKPLRP